MKPSKDIHARLNKLHYKMSDGTKKDKEKAIAKADKLGYAVGSHKRGVAHFRSKDPDDIHNIISIKGTNPREKKDLISDIHLAIGNASGDKQFKRRTNEVKRIYKTIDEGEKKHLTGHSLGGSMVSHMMTKSKSIKDATTSAHTFNPGYTPAFHDELMKDLDKEHKKELKTKLIHHHSKGDPISAGITMTSKKIGRVITTKQTASSPHSLDNFHSEKKDTEDED